MSSNPKIHSLIHSPIATKTTSSVTLTIFVGLLGLALAANTVSGQFVLSPVAVLGTDLGTFSDTVALTNMINQSGMESNFVSGTTVFDTYFATPGHPFATKGSGGTNNWQSNFSFDLPLTGHVDFDLGDTYSLDKMAIWNISLSNVTVRISDTTNGLATGQVAGNFSLTDHQHFFDSYEVDVRPFVANYLGRYVRLEIHSAYKYSASDSYAYAIIGEVVFSALPVTTMPPTVDIVRDPNGDVRVTFTGTLQVATNATATFADVPGSPSATYLIPRETQSAQQYFRAKVD